MKVDIESTVMYYRKKAMDLALRYESASVQKLQMDLRDAMERRRSVIELGCGSGRDAAFLQRNGNIGSLRATDASPEFLREAGRLHPELKDVLGELVLPIGLEKLVAAGERFSGIYSIATLMHLSPADIAETIGLLERISEPGGILFISVCTEREEGRSPDPRTYTLRSPGWWKKAIEKGGFRTVELKITSDGLGRDGTSWLNITSVL